MSDLRKFQNATKREVKALKVGKNSVAKLTDAIQEACGDKINAGSRPFIEKKTTDSRIIHISPFMALTAGREKLKHAQA